MKQVLIVIFSILFLAVCGINGVWRNTAPQPMMEPGSGWVNNDKYESNGERIYFTATNEQGKGIQYSSGQNFGGMMGGGPLACSSCHGPDARGGEHTMHMDVMDAPNIRYSALSGETEEHNNAENGDSHSDEHSEYDLEEFRSAVLEGKHPNGDDLSSDMPRWQMNDEDLADLFGYLKFLR